MRGNPRLVAALVVAVLSAAVVQAALAGPGGGGGGLFVASGTNGFPPGSKGSAKIVDEGLGGQGALLTSISGGPSEAGYGLVGVQGGGIPKTFSGLTDVETQFNVTQGTCAGGAPRWIIDLASPSGPKQTAFLLVYFDNGHQPSGGCNAGTQQETNIINNAATGWFLGNANSPSTYAQVVGTYGNWKLTDVEIVVDAGWSQGGQLNPNIQQVLVQKLKINNNSYLPLPG